MKLLLITIILLLINMMSFSQITFDKGYFIDNSNKKTECFIKNADWRNNPDKFEYKLTQEANAQTAGIDSVKEFSIDNYSKFIRATVQMDRSSNNMSDLTTDKNPSFKEEQLFLKVLAEGKASLYLYMDGSLIRFFYKTNDIEITQLVYKRYLINNPLYDSTGEGSKFGTNKYYQQQLINSFKEENITIKDVKQIYYREKDLERFFYKINGQENSNFTSNNIHKKDAFHLTIRPGLNYSQLSINNTSSLYGPYNFNNTLTPRIGVIAEYILPYNKNKWSVIVEPTFQHMEEETSEENEYIAGGILNVDFDYTSIELPIGLRHYFFLNQKSKLFLNSSIVYDFSTNSHVQFTRKDGATYTTLDINARINLSFGAGYIINDKYSIEFRYFTNRDTLADFDYWSSKLKTCSLVLGYTIF